MSTDRQSELIHQAISGDAIALERLLLDHYTPLRTWLQQEHDQPGKADWDVDDIVQLTFAQVFRNIDRFEPRPDASFLAWIKTIATHQLRDVQRADGRKKRGGDIQRIDGLQDSACQLLDELAVDEHTPSKSVARREAVRAIQVTLAALDEDYRRVIQLRYFEGRSIEETAQLMKRSTGAVRGLLDRAKQKMRDALQRASTYLSSS